MVDREARDKLALATRRFAAGRISEREWEKSLPRRSKDQTLRDVADILEFSFEARRDYFAKGKDALTPETRHNVARCILLFHTNLDYDPKPCDSASDTAWRTVISITACLLVLPLIVMMMAPAILGVSAASLWRKINGGPDPRAEGDRIWPFESQSDLDEALKYPKYLCGRA
jgi:hypothetical protein